MRYFAESKRSLYLTNCFKLAMVPVALLSSCAAAQEADYEAELNRQARVIEKLLMEIELLKTQQQKLAQAQASQRKHKKSSTTAPPLPPQTQAQVAQPTNSKNSSSPAEPVGQTPPEPQADTRALPESTAGSNGVLIGDGRFAWETSLSYSYNDNNRVFLDAYSFIPALVVGLIDIRQIKRHSFIGSVSGKYGLTDRWEVELKVPYVNRKDSQRSRPVSVGVSDDEIFNANGDGIGDVQLSTRYQLNEAGQGVIYVANLGVTFPTGTSPFDVEFVESTPGSVFPTELPTGAGYVSVQPGLSAIYPSDPGVFFGSLSYAWNDKIDDDQTGEVDAGDAIGLSFGLGLSLNERTSMSVSYSHKHVLESQINDVRIDGSELDIGQLIIGYAFRYSPLTNINVSLAVGVTDDAQDVRLNLRVPVTVE